MARKIDEKKEKKIAEIENLRKQIKRRIDENNDGMFELVFCNREWGAVNRRDMAMRALHDEVFDRITTIRSINDDFDADGLLRAYNIAGRNVGKPSERYYLRIDGHHETRNIMREVMKEGADEKARDIRVKETADEIILNNSYIASKFATCAIWNYMHEQSFTDIINKNDASGDWWGNEILITTQFGEFAKQYASMLYDEGGKDD